MCVVAVKYLQQYGWVGAKNRDRNYLVSVDIVKSNREGLQRIYIDDQTTRWTEGLNEHGLCILSASLSVKSDEKEFEKVAPKKSGQKNPIVSPAGLAIRKALLLKTPKEAAAALIKSELAGATFIFNADECYCLEGGFTIHKDDADKQNPRVYQYELQKLTNDIGNYAVRTNHGIYLPYLGYSKNGKDLTTIRNRKSSESRLAIVEKEFDKTEIKSPGDVLKCLSVQPKSDLFMNPIRVGDPKRGDMVTTGQLLLVPSECTLHYRPIFSNVAFDYPGINNKENSKVFFEIISNRKLLSFKKFKNLDV